MFPAAGKHGRKRNFRSREPTANEWIDNGDDSTPFLWSNNARRRLVAATAARLFRIVDLYCLFDLGGVSGRSLFFRQLHLPLLFAGAFRRFAAQLVWGKTKLVAGLVNLFAGVTNSLGKQCAPTFGGCNRCSSFSDCRPLLFIRPGRRFRALIIFSAITSPPFIRRSFSAIRRTVGLGQNQIGGRVG